jgi:hypothetical protein
LAAICQPRLGCWMKGDRLMANRHQTVMNLS